MQQNEYPAPSGLYDPRFEHDACGVGFVADINGVPSRSIVSMGIGALCNMEHRGATGAEANSGDGAGILIQVPDAFLRAVVDFDLPAAGHYAVGMAFLPTDPDAAEKAMASIEAIVADEGLRTVGWRTVPVDSSCLGTTALRAMPAFRHLVVADATGDSAAGIELDRKVFVARKRIEHELPPEQSTFFPSLSSRTLIYKGMLTTPQLSLFFTDLGDERMESAVALVHSRFSTNTFPSWPLAHPYRYIAHNGEINTVQGNRNWMRTREALLQTDVLPGLERAFPICTPGASDSATFDEVLELLHLSGRSLPHAMLMMIPEAWENNTIMSPEKRAFYRFHSSLMEPWDGPASVAFTDGTVVGSVLDRNGLRPGRYWVTDDNLVVLASEAGVIDIDPARIVKKGRLQPGKMFLVDMAQGRIVSDDEVKAGLAAEHPYGQWLDDGLVELDSLAGREHVVFSHTSVLRRQQVFGYTHEELKIIVAPMAKSGTEPIGSMGTDTPIAVLSDRPRVLFDYFQQLFAQVTNPPLDAIREEVVTAVGSTIGPEHNLLAPGPESCRQLVLPFPIIDNDELAKILHIDDDGGFPHLKAAAISGLYRVNGGGLALKRALDMVRHEVSKAISDGARIIVLSDRNSDEALAPIPSLLLTAAVHHHLVREKKRTQVGLVVECGDAREVHHMALLVGYGAGAINPYLAFESIEDMISEDLNGLGGMDPHKAVKNFIKASGKGVLKVMSKMGVSTVASYTGAQIFEAIGLGRELVDEYFTPLDGPSAPSGGAGPSQARARRRVPVAARGRGAPLQPGDRLQAAALHAHEAVRHLQAVHEPGRRSVAQAGHVARPVRLEAGRSGSRPPRRGRAGGRDRQALLHGSDELREHQRRGARDARDRDELHRRQEQHRRGWRGLRPAARPAPPQQHQAGRQRTLRGDERVPRQRGRHPDQDGPGRQAGRGRSAARSQGVSVDRQDPAQHPGRRLDQSAATPRHLLDRRSQAADPRPQERQPVGSRARQARRGDGGRNGRRRSQQGQGRRRADQRP
jgi:glutamate synthase (NADPH/NADH) large chain